MFISFKNKRDEELPLMTLAEQAKNLLVRGQWLQKMIDTCTKEAAGKKK